MRNSEFYSAYEKYISYLSANQKKIATLLLAAKAENYLRDELIWLISQEYAGSRLIASNFGNETKYDICVINKKNIELLAECKYFVNRNRWWAITDGTTKAAATELVGQLSKPPPRIDFVGANNETESYNITIVDNRIIGLVFIAFISDAEFPGKSAKIRKSVEFVGHIQELIGDKKLVVEKPVDSEIKVAKKAYRVELSVGLIT